MKNAFLFPTISEIPPSFQNKTLKKKQICEFEDCLVLRTGPGKNIVATMERFRPVLAGCRIILIGYAGALLPRLQRGDIVVCKAFATTAGRKIPASPFSAAITDTLDSLGLTVWNGNSHTEDAVLNDPAAKKKMMRKAMTMIVDMENYWAANKAREWKIPFDSVRIVLDEFSENLPDMVDTLTGEGKISFPHVLRHLIRHPRHIHSMLEVFRDTSFLHRRIETCCKAIRTLERQ